MLIFDAFWLDENEHGEELASKGGVTYLEVRDLHSREVVWSFALTPCKGISISPMILSVATVWGVQRRKIGTIQQR